MELFTLNLLEQVSVSISNNSPPLAAPLNFPSDRSWRQAGGVTSSTLSHPTCPAPENHQCTRCKSGVAQMDFRDVRKAVTMRLPMTFCFAGLLAATARALTSLILMGSLRLVCQPCWIITGGKDLQQPCTVAPCSAARFFFSFPLLIAVFTCLRSVCTLHAVAKICLYFQHYCFRESKI